MVGESQRAPKARAEGSQGQSAKRAAPGSLIIRNSGPQGRQNTAGRVSVAPAGLAQFIGDRSRGGGARYAAPLPLATFCRPCGGARARFIGDRSRGGGARYAAPLPLATFCRPCGAPALYRGSIQGRRCSLRCALAPGNRLSPLRGSRVF
jgi:hypothetical protein